MTVEPYKTVTASPRGSDAVSELAGTIEPRKFIGLTVNAPRGATAVVYLGFIAPSARIDETPQGWSNTADYTNARSIPRGQPVLVVWPGMGARSSECSATFHLEG